MRLRFDVESFLFCVVVLQERRDLWILFMYA